MDLDGINLFDHGVFHHKDLNTTDTTHARLLGSKHVSLEDEA